MCESREDIKNSVGLIIKRLRKFRMFTREDLSKAAGVSVNTLYFCENGKTAPTVDNLFKICHGLRVSPVTLLSMAIQEMEKARDEKTERAV